MPQTVAAASNVVLPYFVYFVLFSLFTLVKEVLFVLVGGEPVLGDAVLLFFILFFSFLSSVGFLCCCVCEVLCFVFGSVCRT